MLKLPDMSPRVGVAHQQWHFLSVHPLLDRNVSGGLPTQQPAKADEKEKKVRVTKSKDVGGGKRRGASPTPIDLIEVGANAVARRFQRTKKLRQEKLCESEAVGSLRRERQSELEPLLNSREHAVEKQQVLELYSTPIRVRAGRIPSPTRFQLPQIDVAPQPSSNQVAIQDTSGEPPAPVQPISGVPKIVIAQQLKVPQVTSMLGQSLLRKGRMDDDSSMRTRLKLVEDAHKMQRWQAQMDIHRAIAEERRKKRESHRNDVLLTAKNLETARRSTIEHSIEERETRSLVRCAYRPRGASDVVPPIAIVASIYTKSRTNDVS